MSNSILNSIGLIFDIVGACLLFRYGLPSKFNEPPTLLLQDGLSEKEIKANKKIQCLANVGLICLILGFIFQLVSNFI